MVDLTNTVKTSMDLAPWWFAVHANGLEVEPNIFVTAKGYDGLLKQRYSPRATKTTLKFSQGVNCE